MSYSHEYSPIYVFIRHMFVCVCVFELCVGARVSALQVGETEITKLVSRNCASVTCNLCDFEIGPYLRIKTTMKFSPPLAVCRPRRFEANNILLLRRAIKRNFGRVSVLSPFLFGFI